MVDVVAIIQSKLSVLVQIGNSRLDTRKEKVGGLTNLKFLQEKGLGKLCSPEPAFNDGLIDILSKSLVSIMSSFGGKELDIPSLTVIWMETCHFGNSTDTGTVSAPTGAHLAGGLFLSVAVWAVFNLVFQKLHTLRLPQQASALEFLIQVYVLRRRPAAALHALVKRYGPVMRVKAWWCQDVVVLSSVAAVEEFYKLHDAEFGARPASMGRPSLSNAVASFVFPFLNAYWHHLHLVLDMTAKDIEDSGLDWALQALHRHPEVEHHIRSELHANAASPPALANLPYLRAVVKELFRLHPPCAVSFPHESADEWCTLLGFAVRPRTQVVVNIYAVQRDPAVWANSEDFDPARFVASPEIEIHQMKEFQMVPFGGGIRRCPAAKMAVEHVQVGLAKYYLRN